MAESDIMLVSIKLDADGAIQKTEILDTKFKSLGASMQKGKTRTEGMTEAQEKFTKATTRSTKSTVESNVATIGKLAAFEAATSGLNQLISAQYKRIDAALAEGKIDEEEAERQRKKIKQQEKYTGMLETGIAIGRLYTVGQMVMAAATASATVATDANTKSVRANTIAMLANPWVIFGLAIAAVVVVMADFWVKSGGVRRIIEDINEVVDSAVEKWNAFGDSVKGAVSWIGEGTAALGLSPADVAR